MLLLAGDKVAILIAIFQELLLKMSGTAKMGVRRLRFKFEHWHESGSGYLGKAPDFSGLPFPHLMKLEVLKLGSEEFRGIEVGPWALRGE